MFPCRCQYCVKALRTARIAQTRQHGDDVDDDNNNIHTHAPCAYDDYVATASANNTLRYCLEQTVPQTLHNNVKQHRIGKHTTISRRRLLFTRKICVCSWLLVINTIWLSSGSGAFVYADRLWWRCGGVGPRREETERLVCVCRLWRGTTNRPAAAVCRSRTRPNGEPAARRQLPFEPFPAHREQLLCPTPAHRRRGGTTTLRHPVAGPPQREARQKSDSSACCYAYTRARSLARDSIFYIHCGAPLRSHC